MSLPPLPSSAWIRRPADDEEAELREAEPGWQTPAVVIATVILVLAVAWHLLRQVLQGF